MEKILNEKIAVVTGGTRGIGFSIVRKFLEEGARVILCGSREATAHNAVEKILTENPEAPVEAIWPDLTDPEAVGKAFADIVARHGRIDILVNNAGIVQRTSFYDYTPEEYDSIMDLNVKALVVASQAAARHMREQGKGVIINTSSMVSIYGQPAGVMYPASKAAVNGITKSLARELGKDGIRVNAVAPGVVRTDMVAKLPAELVQPIVNRIPLGRMAEPDEIADAFVFLASDRASYITGSIISVDGGDVN